MATLKAVIFDLDGTLLDSAPELRQAINLTLNARGRRPLTLDEVKKVVGDGMYVTINRAFAATGAPLDEAGADRELRAFIDYYRNITPDQSVIYPHVVETLKSLQKAQIKIGLCTNKIESATLHLLEILHLKDYFDFIAGVDTFPVHKPHAGHVLGVLHKLNVSAANAVMIGDSENDVLSAHGAGVPCIVVTHGYGRHMESLGAQALMSGFDKFAETLPLVGFDPVPFSA